MRCGKSRQLAAILGIALFNTPSAYRLGVCLKFRASGANVLVGPPLPVWPAGHDADEGVGTTFARNVGPFGPIPMRSSGVTSRSCGLACLFVRMRGMLIIDVLTILLLLTCQIWAQSRCAVGLAGCCGSYYAGPNTVKHAAPPLLCPTGHGTRLGESFFLPSPPSSRVGFYTLILQWPQVGYLERRRY